MLSEFREFLEKFNVIPVAVGLILALQFGPVVDAVVSVIMSLVGKVGGLDTDFNSWQPGNIPIGTLITALISFLLVAFIVFMIVKSLARAGARTTPAATPDQALLGEIRDLLKSR